MGKVRGICHAVDSLNEWTGKVICWIFVAQTLILTVEVVLRYFFNRPSIWSWDVLLMLMAVMAVTGAGYTLLHRGHVMVDVVVNRFSPRARAIVDLVTSGLLFLMLGILLWISVGQAGLSIGARERFYSVWAPPLYPLKIIWVIGIILLLLQGIVKFIRDLTIALSGVKGES